MPELPEVETIRRQLAPHLEGRRIRDDRDPRRAMDPTGPHQVRSSRSFGEQSCGTSGAPASTWSGR